MIRFPPLLRQEGVNRFVRHLFKLLCDTSSTRGRRCRRFRLQLTQDVSGEVIRARTLQETCDLDANLKVGFNAVPNLDSHQRIDPQAVQGLIHAELGWCQLKNLGHFLEEILLQQPARQLDRRWK